MLLDTRARGAFCLYETVFGVPRRGHVFDGLSLRR
jgi:hypothetical protein